MNTKLGHHVNSETLNVSQNQVEIDLLNAIAKGDEKALEQLYLAYYSRLLRFIVRITCQTDRTDEIINQVMFVVWQKAKTYNAIRCRPSTWIFGIAYNKARKAMQLTKYDQTESLDGMNQEQAQFEQNDDSLKQLELKNWLENALNKLSPEQRTVIELSFFHGMHYSEIAELMDCPENTIKTRMHHAKKKLKPSLQSLKDVD